MNGSTPCSRGGARAAWALALALAVACGSAGDRGSDPAYTRGSTVVVALTSVEDVKPDRTDYDFLTFLPLATENEHGELEGRLARGWEHSADHQEYTFHLRTDVRWGDGVPATAHDVKFTLDLLGHPDVGEYPGIEATVLNDSTVRIRASNPYYVGDIVYYPKHLLEGLDPKRFWDWDFWTRPVGNGPYRFVRYVPHTMMEFETNPDYYRARPRIERVILKFVGGAGLTELLAGNVDIVGEIDLTQIPWIAKNRRFRIYHDLRASGTRAIYWKMDHPLFSDARVRRALTLALDRRELLRLLNLPPDLPITDGVFTSRQLRRGEFPEPLPYDPEQARALLAAAGWVDGDGDGVRENHGRSFRFTASVRQGNGFPQLALYVKEMLRQVGVQMEIQMVDAAQIWEKLETGDFEAWLASGPTGAHLQVQSFGRGNSSGYRNLEAFEILDSLQTTAEPEQVDRLYRRLTDIYRADMPFTRLMPMTVEWVAHQRVRGLSTPFRGDPEDKIDELWLEEP